MDDEHFAFAKDTVLNLCVGNSLPRELFLSEDCEDFLCSVCLNIPSPQGAVETLCCGTFFCLDCIEVLNLIAVQKYSYYL